MTPDFQSRKPSQTSLTVTYNMEKKKKEKKGYCIIRSFPFKIKYRSPMFCFQHICLEAQSHYHFSNYSFVCFNIDFCVIIKAVPAPGKEYFSTLKSKIPIIPVLPPKQTLISYSGLFIYVNVSSSCIINFAFCIFHNYFINIFQFNLSNL